MCRHKKLEGTWDLCTNVESDHYIYIYALNCKDAPLNSAANLPCHITGMVHRTEKTKQTGSSSSSKAGSDIPLI